MESHELAPLVAWIHRRSLFIQSSRHLLRDRQQDNIDVKRPKKAPPRNRKNEFGQQRIVEAARAHFFCHGFRSVTMDQLAEELGISKKTLYAHFPGKFDLLQAVLADKLVSVEAALKEVTRSHPHDFPAALRDLLAGTHRALDEMKPRFVRDMSQKEPEVFKLVERSRAALIQR